MIKKPRETWFFRNNSNQTLIINDIFNAPPIGPGQRIDLLIYAPIIRIRDSVVLSNYIQKKLIIDEGYLHTHDDKADEDKTQDNFDLINQTLESKADKNKVDEIQSTLNEKADISYVDEKIDEIEPIKNHNILDDLQGGDNNEYYHLTFKKYSLLDLFSDSTDLIFNGVNVSEHVRNDDIHFLMSDIEISPEQVIDLDQYITAISVLHNSTGGLQGGSLGQYYHLNLDKYNVVQLLSSNENDDLIFNGINYTSHIEDASIHFEMGSISITESQISDLQNYLTNITNESILDLSDVNDNGLTETGQILVWNNDEGYFETSFNVNDLKIESIFELIDVAGNISDFSDGDILSWQGDNFVKTNYVYTNAEPSVVSVGGIEEGTTFDQLKFDEFVDKLLYPELFGELTLPSATFVLSESGFREIGDILNITLSSGFDRGGIDPQYESSSEFRSGLPNRYQYQYNSIDIHNEYTSDLSDQYIVNNHEVVLGLQVFSGRVYYDAGVQPKGSKGSDFDSPLSAGITNYINRTITGVYPFFATTSNIDTMTKQPLAAMNSSYVQTDMVGESGADKQSAEFPDDWSLITGIQFFNTVSNSWEWINGSKINSLLTFDTSVITRNINGYNISYNKYIHNGVFIGVRNLRWYTT